MGKVTFFRVSARSQRKPAIETQLGYFIDRQAGWGKGRVLHKERIAVLSLR